MYWELMKSRALERLAREIMNGAVDEEVLELLDAINSIDKVFTTSSCAGRITVVCSDAPPNDKISARIVLKSHSPVSVRDVKEAVESAQKCAHVWAQSSHPLLDLMVKELDLAWRLVDLAKRAGFKYSGVQRSKDYYRVIIRSNDNIQIPMENGEDLKKLARTVSALNKFLLDGKVKLARLISLIDEELLFGEELLERLLS